MTADSHEQVVLDTSVVSILFRPNDTRFPFYDRSVQGLRPFISFQTIEELLYGGFRASWGSLRIRGLMGHLDQYEVVWPNHSIVELSATIRAERASAGRMLKCADAWIAATALYLACPLASDDNDFDGIFGLELIRRV